MGIEGGGDGETNLLEAEDELITALFGEVLLGEEALGRLELLVGLIAVLLGNFLVEGILG